MSRFRSLAFTMATAAVTAAATVAVVGPPATGHPGGGDRPSDWWRPPRDVRTMLDQVSSKSLERYDRGLVGFGTRHTLSTQDDPNRGIGAARDWIKAELEQSAATSDGRMTVALDSYVQPAGTTRIDVDTTITNVYATLKGTDPTSADRVYVIGGHYDSRVTDVMNRTSDAPGANDDASGVSAVLELARVMAPHPTASTIVFVAYAGEEQNLYGSNHLAQFAKDQGWNVQGVFNMDIIGSSLGGNGVSEPHQIRLFSEGVPTAVTQGQLSRLISLGGESDSASRQLARFVKETGENNATDMEVKLVFRRDRFLRGGDQLSWQQRGWPGVRFTEPNENFDHQHQDIRVENGKQIGDLPEFVDFRYLARVTRVIGSALAALERSPRAPANARVISANLTYDTQLRWNPNPESDIAGYELVWRDTTEPLWTHAKFVGNVTDATIQNLNKDDYQVGVRAVDRDGNRSPVAFPVPASS